MRPAAHLPSHRIPAYLPRSGIALLSCGPTIVRGELKDWFGPIGIWIEATLAGVAFYLFFVHTATATDRSFLNRDLLKNLNFTVRAVLMFTVGLIMNGTLAPLPTMLQSLLNYPALTTGLITAPRGIGSMIAMFVIAV